MKSKTLLVSVFCFGSLILALDVSAQADAPNVYIVNPQVPQTSDDLALTARVNDQIRGRVRNFSRENYNIFSQAGQVTVVGHAHSQSEVDEILSAARLASGANSIVNAVTVSPTF